MPLSTGDNRICFSITRTNAIASAVEYWFFQNLPPILFKYRSVCVSKWKHISSAILRPYPVLDRPTRSVPLRFRDVSSLWMKNTSISSTFGNRMLCRFSFRIPNSVSKIVNDVGFYDGNSVETVPKPVKTVFEPISLNCSAVFEWFIHSEDGHSSTEDVVKRCRWPNSSRTTGSGQG